MRQVTVFVNDYPAKRRMGVGFNAADYDKVEAAWNKEDQRLLALQAIPAFHGYKRWSQCKTEHYRVMIVRTMLMMNDMTDADRADPEHPVVSTFNFLVLALVKCIEVATGSSVEIMHVNRLASTELVFDYTAVMDLSFAQPPPLEDDDEDSPFKIIVDNTKK